MSSKNIIRSQLPSGAASLSRTLLACRFDFQQKSWSLPALESPQVAAAALINFAREISPAFKSKESRHGRRNFSAARRAPKLLRTRAGKF